jgi:hypothetical protein
MQRSQGEWHAGFRRVSACRLRWDGEGDLLPSQARTLQGDRTDSGGSALSANRNLMRLADPTFDTCETLFRAEMLAIAAYNRTIDEFAHSPREHMLERIRTTHEKNADSLRFLIFSHEAEPSPCSVFWRGLVQTLDGPALMTLDSTVIGLLKEGEEHGIREYREALSDPDVSEELKELICQELLPRLINHVEELRRSLNPPVVRKRATVPAGIT